MEKPFTVVYEDFRQDLANLINTSGLPVVIIENVLQSYLNEIKSIAKKQYEIEKAQYEKSLMEENKEKKD